MKKIQRLISTILLLAIMFSCFGAGAFAASESTVKQYGKDENGGLIVFGDSIARGCCSCPEEYGGVFSENDRYKKFEYRNVYGSFSYLLAKAIGCSMPELMVEERDADGRPANYWPVCYAGQTLHNTMRWLGIANGWDDHLADTSLDNFSIFAENYGGVENCRENVIKCIEKSGLIVVELGMADILCQPTVAGEGDTIEETIEGFVTNMYASYENWKEEFPVFIKFLRDTNPNATIVVLGAFNAAQGLRLTDDTLLPIGNAGSVLFSLMNRYFRKFVCETGDPNMIYVDISNTDSPVSEADKFALTKDFALNPDIFDVYDIMMMNFHPSVEGYAYIYRQILNALPEDESIIDPPKPDIALRNTDIVLDLGHFNHVDYVMLDKKFVSNFRQSESFDHTIIVPCNKRTAKTLTIGVVQEDGKFAIYTYQLSFRDNHYSAYRIAGVNDTAKAVTTLVSNVFTVGSTILKTFSKLFTK